MIQTLNTVMQLFKGSNFSMWLLRDISSPIRPSRTVQRMYFIIYEFCFTNFEVEYKRSYIFQSSSSEKSIIDIRYGLNLGSMWPINCGFRSFKENAYFLAEPPQNGSAEPHR